MYVDVMGKKSRGFLEQNMWNTGGYTPDFRKPPIFHELDGENSLTSIKDLRPLSL